MNFYRDSNHSSINQFNRKYAIDLNNIFHLIDTIIENENYRVVNRDKLFKTLTHYIHNPTLDIQLKKDNIDDEMESYYFLKEAKILDLVIEIQEYACSYCPWLLEYVHTYDLVELLSSFIDIKNPFTIIENDSDTEEEEYDESINY